MKRYAADEPTLELRLREYANWGGPNEVCGYVLESGEVLKMRNVAEEPWGMFVMDPVEVLKAYSAHDDIVAVFHSHPAGTPQWWSRRDQQMLIPGITNLLVIVGGPILAARGEMYGSFDASAPGFFRLGG